MSQVLLPLLLLITSTLGQISLPSSLWMWRSASCITHIRDTGNSGYSDGVSGASVAPAAAVDHFNPGTDLAPVITVVKASTTSNVSSVAVTASAEANDNGSGWDDFEKPFEMLLEEELEMWKEKENDSMDEGAQEDEQFEMEIDNGRKR